MSRSLHGLGRHPDILWKQGNCCICKVALFGYQKKRRDCCGDPKCRAKFEKKFGGRTGTRGSNPKPASDAEHKRYRVRMDRVVWR